MTTSEPVLVQPPIVDEPVTPKVSRAAKIVAAGALVLLGVHMFFTAVYNVPSTQVKYESLPGRVAAGYINPYLLQDYKIFAPEPVDSNHQLWTRAWVELPDGQRVRSEWINTSEVEIAVAYRKVLRKQLSVVGAERLMSAYYGMDEVHREVAAKNHLGGEALYELRDALVAADDSQLAAVDHFIRVDNYVTSYATQVAEAMWGDEGRILAVQVRAVYEPVPRWADRHESHPPAQASSFTDLGWVQAMEWPGQNQEEFAKTFTGWAEQAGVNPGLEAADEAQEGEASS